MNTSEKNQLNHVSTELETFKLHKSDALRTIPVINSQFVNSKEYFNKEIIPILSDGLAVLVQER